MSLEEAGTPNDQDVVTSPPDGRERVEGLGDKVEGKEMDILKDLPSYNSSNFSRLLGTSSAAITATATTGKNNSVSTGWLCSYLLRVCVCSFGSCPTAHEVLCEAKKAM